MNPVCCPAAGWITLGSGRFRLHVDYLQSNRHREGHGNYSLGQTCTPTGDCTDIRVEGRRASVQRADLAIETGSEINVLMSWRALDRPRYRLHILFGGFYRHLVKSFCRAFDGPMVRIPTPLDWPPDYVVFRAELTAEERRRCSDDVFSSRLEFLERPGSLQLSQVQVLIAFHSLYRIFRPAVPITHLHACWSEAKPR